jgi:3-hydroxybutyryl-CoA dehydratase
MAELTYIVHGKYWDELSVGDRFRTHRRTVTEADLVGFIGATGMLEQIFIDADHGGAMGGRPVPAALTYCFIEGLQMQSLVQGTGLALLEVATKVDAPVRVGDSIWATIEVASIRATSKGNRGVISFAVIVFNQHDVQVMNYAVKRLMAGRPTSG